MNWKCLFFHKWKIMYITRPFLNYSKFYYICSRCGENKTMQLQGKWAIDENGKPIRIGIKREKK